MKTNAESRTRPSIELALWLYARLSGLAMLVLVLGHLGVMHLTDLRRTLSAAVVRERLDSPFWLTFDLTLLVLALTHGAVGARAVAADHLSGRRIRTAVTWICLVVTTLFAILGTAVLIGLRNG
jgi:succinate dehydrogenase / fumarate reductase membrane anchor subunit